MIAIALKISEFRTIRRETWISWGPVEEEKRRDCLGTVVVCQTQDNDTLSEGSHLQWFLRPSWTLNRRYSSYRHHRLRCFDPHYPQKQGRFPGLPLPKPITIKGGQAEKVGKIYKIDNERKRKEKRDDWSIIRDCDFSPPTLLLVLSPRKPIERSLGSSISCPILG